jgi:hypothetical protein
VLDTPIPGRAAAQRAAQPRLNAINAKIDTASAALNKCLEGLLPQKVAGAQPKDILHINFQTPNFGGNGTGNDWAGPIAGGNTFPFSQGFEWMQVMDTNNEYDATPAGATGWAVYQDIASNDAVGLHPFGNDWEFECVLDPEYLNLLSQGNISQSGVPQIANDLTALSISPSDIQNAARFGLLGVEWDSGLVPDLFQAEFSDGDRVAIFGRWIVDCGHDDFHTEIHPPLLLASASVYQKPSVDAFALTQFTRALITSRPYLVGQTFANSPGINDIYNDSSGDDGHFLEHILTEVAKAEENLSLQVEAHPKIKQFPFQGVHLFELIVKTTQAPPIVVSHGSLVVSFHFTIRSGCTVEVAPNDSSSVKVYIVLNSAGYTPPNLPTRNDIHYSLSELNSSFGPSGFTEILEGTGGLLNAVVDPTGALTLSKGLVTDKYDSLPAIDFRKATAVNAAINVPGSAIPPGKGITVDNTQPFPITGWIEVGYGSSGGGVLSGGNITGGQITTHPTTQTV